MFFLIYLIFLNCCDGGCLVSVAVVLDVAAVAAPFLGCFLLWLLLLFCCCGDLLQLYV